MSKPDKRSYIGPNDPLYYAPREFRERADEPSASEAPAHANDWPERPRSAETFLRQSAGRDVVPPRMARRDQADGFARAVVAQDVGRPAYRNAPALHDQPATEPAGRFGGMTRLVSVVVAVAAALIVVWAIIAFWSPNDSLAEKASQRRAPPTLLVQEGRGSGGDAVPLGVSVNAAAPGTSVVVTRLPSGARLTVGKRINASQWRVSVPDLAIAAVEPPDGFVGEMNLVAELRNADNVVLVSSLLRLSWTEVPALTSALTSMPAFLPAPQPAVAPPSPPKEVFRKLAPQEIAMLFRRAQELLGNGDFQSARLMLVRAAEAGDAGAALALAKTYDPVMLRKFGIQGPLPDLAQARDWYQKAQEWGEPAAQAQLDALARLP